MVLDTNQGKLIYLSQTLPLMEIKPPIIQVFMPINMPPSILDTNKGMKYVKKSFDSSQVLLCYCHKCVQLYFLSNNYVQLMRFNHAFVTKVSKNIKNEAHRQQLLGHYSVISTKEGIIKDMILNKGTLGLTCPKCLNEYFLDHYEAMHELDRNVLLTNNDTSFIITSELIEAELRLIAELYQPLFRGYTTQEDIKQNLTDSDNSDVNNMLNGNGNGSGK